MTRGYQQHCPIAVALDELGDRWVLLILRELMLGPQRFTDLRHALPGIAPNLLSDDSAPWRMPGSWPEPCSNPQPPGPSTS